MAGLFDLSGKTALITGSSGGLGLAMARGLAEAGAAIVLNGRDAAKLTEAVEALRAAGHRVVGHAFDVAEEAAVKAAFERFDGEGLAIDIMVNNAGIQFRKPMLELATADWRRVIETNLTSAFVVGREAARRMVDRGRGGKIINIGSLTSEVARVTVAPYTAAKGGIKLLTRSMAAEWARHDIQATRPTPVAVNLAIPGIIMHGVDLLDIPTNHQAIYAQRPASSSLFHPLEDGDRAAVGNVDSDHPAVAKPRDLALLNRPD